MFTKTVRILRTGLREVLKWTQRSWQAPREVLTWTHLLHKPTPTVVCKAKKSDDILLMLQTLHGLRAAAHVQYKMSNVRFNSPWNSYQASAWSSSTLHSIQRAFNPALHPHCLGPHVIPVPLSSLGWRQRQVERSLFERRGLLSATVCRPHTLCHSDSASCFETALKIHQF